MYNTTPIYIIPTCIIQICIKTIHITQIYITTTRINLIYITKISRNSIYKHDRQRREALASSLDGAPLRGRKVRSGRGGVALIEAPPVTGHDLGEPVDRVHDALRGFVERALRLGPGQRIYAAATRAGRPHAALSVSLGSTYSDTAETFLMEMGELPKPTFLQPIG
ncbi:hypothetical protein ACU4GR_04525 [Methylobacterium oryzae CBMB20]